MDTDATLENMDSIIYVLFNDDSTYEEIEKEPDLKIWRYSYFLPYAANAGFVMYCKNIAAFIRLASHLKDFINISNHIHDCGGKFE